MHPPKKIQRRQLNNSNLSDLNHLPPLLQRVYAQRGVTSASEIERGLATLLPFHDLKGIDPAVQRLTAAIQQQQRILIVGDFDADGATSTTVAVRGLRMLGAQHVDFIVPNRFEYGYGLSPEIVTVSAARQPQVIVTVDNGISSIEGVALAGELGIDVVITDHHLAGDTLPAAAAIVNPNQPGCSFKSKNLAGVGVIFYVLMALRAQLRSIGWFTAQNLAEPALADLLDIVALGTVADVVPLDANNRILVHQGLQRIRAGKCCAGIRALLEIAKRDASQLNAQDLGFVLGPRLNAAGRMDDMSIGIECLLTDDPTKAASLAQILEQLNRDRRQVETSMRADAQLLLDKISLGRELPMGICLYDETWHQGVIGILAARVKERLHRPVICFGPSLGDEIKGSARSIPGLHIRDALDAVAKRYPDLVSKFGGHAMAAGLTLHVEHFERFSAAFDAEVRSRMTADDLCEKIMSDGPLDPQDRTIATALMLQEAGPWGQGFPQPQFDGQFILGEQRVVGENHLKMLVIDQQTGEAYDAIAFNFNFDNWPKGPVQKVELAYQLDVNEFRGKRNLQLLVQHVEVAL